MRTTSVAAAVVAALLTLACRESNAPGEAAGSLLAGLNQASATDSAGHPVPQPTQSTTPGVFRGTVLLGPTAAGAGNDSLEVAPRVAGAVLTAYPTTTPFSAAPILLPAVATVTTGADGRFTFPSLPGGAYVVTVTPPATSSHSGMWVTAIAHAGSGDYPWWVVIPRR